MSIVSSAVKPYKFTFFFSAKITNFFYQSIALNAWTLFTEIRKNPILIGSLGNI